MLGTTVELRSSVGPIVGREKELAHLDESLAALDEGAPACVAVEGEPGIGKTRLLAELRSRAADRGHIVLTGAAAEFEREMPFGVWVDALDAYVESHDLAQHEQWTPELAGELAQVLPSLHRQSGGEAAVADERYRAHRAVRRLLGLIADSQPVVLVLDDLHWSDAASVELIAALVSRQPPANVLLALGYRPRQVDKRLTASVATPNVTKLVLEELAQQDAVLLLQDMDPDAAAAVYRHGGGNPFYLEQLGRTVNPKMLATAPDGARAAEAGVPMAVAGAIAAELDSLSPGSRAFLDAAAVAGEPFEPDIAAAIAELPDTEGLEALDDLLGLDLVRSTAVPRQFVFRHPIVRGAVYESTRGGWRLAAHTRAAEALAARGASAAERAHHVEQSAAPGDQGAIELLLEAGQAAASRAPDTAARWFEAALRLLPSDDTKRQVDVRVALASAERSLGELEACRARLLEATDLLPAEASMRRVELTALCAAVEHWQGRHEEAHRRLTRAWDDVRDRTTPEAAALQIELAVDGLYGNDFERSFEMGQAALETARALNDPSLIAAAASALALGEAAAERTESARKHRAEALEQIAAMEDADLARRLETLYYLGWAETYLEQYDEAIAHAQQGVAIARATGEGRLLVPLMLIQGYPFEQQGRLAEANEMCETAVEIARLSANPHFLFWALFELAWARYYLGDLDAAIAAGEESVEVGGRQSGGTMPSSGGGAGWTLAVCRFELGEVAEAREMMFELGGEEMEKWIPSERYFNWENVALAELALGNIEDATTIAEHVEQSAAQVDLRLPTVLSARTRAAVQLASGDVAGAARAAEKSIAAAEAIGATLHVAYSRILLGQALVAADERQRAIAVLREAERELDLCGSIRVRDEARRELRKLGARAEVRGPATASESGIASLTKRELEIAELITDRLTNQEIADKLFLSKKTIESHIRNLFVKLGASSRVEVARIVEREQHEQADPA